MFEDIKAGDTVYINIRVEYDWNSGKTFRVARKVDRTTKTQFIIGNKRYRKDDGSVIGGSCIDKALKEGVDQSIEAKKYYDQIRMWHKVRNFAIRANVEVEDERIPKILDHIIAIENILEDK